MARAGIYKSEVLRARDKLRATGRNRGQAGIEPVLTHKPFGYVK